MEVGNGNGNDNGAVLSPETTNSNTFDGSRDMIIHEPSNGIEDALVAKNSKRKASELKKQVEDSKHGNKRLLHEKEELQKQLNTLKQQYESDSSNKKKIERFLEKQEALNMGDAKARKQAISRELHTLNGMEEEKALSSNSNDSILSCMLQKAIDERNTLHTNVLDNLDALRKHLSNELWVIKDGATAFAIQHEKKIKQAKWDREHMLEQLNEESKNVETKIKELKKGNEQTSKEIKEKDNQMRKLESKMKEQEADLASHNNKYQSVQGKLDGQLKAEQNKKNQLQATVDNLKKRLEKQKTEKQEALDKKRELEREKNQFVQDQSKELEKDLRKKQTEKITLQKQLAQKGEELKKIQHELEREKDKQKKQEMGLEVQKTQVNATDAEVKHLQQALEDTRRNSTDHSAECKRMQTEMKPLQKSIDQLTIINADLHKNLREKGQKEKELQDREKHILAKEKALDQPPKKSKSKPKTDTLVSRQRKVDSGAGNRNRPDAFSSMKPTWDPLFQYRTLFPFPWLSVALFLLLFLSLITK